MLMAWRQLPAVEREQRLKALRMAAWLCLGQQGARVAVCCQCAEANVAGSMDALVEQLERLPTLSKRKLLSALANVELRK